MKVNVAGAELELSDNYNEVIDRNSTPCEIFTELYFTKDNVAKMVEQCNIYRQYKNLKCRNVEMHDFLRFIGTLVFSSCVGMTGVAKYWAKHTRQALVADNFTKNAFEEILSCLHFADPALEPDKGSPAYNKLYKIQMLLDMMNNSMNIVKPEARVAVDEQMVTFKGKTAPEGMRQYMQKKPVKYGYKNFACVGSSGFIYRVEWYTGKEMPNQVPQNVCRRRSSTISEDTPDEPDLTKSALTVWRMVKTFPVGTEVYFDNWFGTLNLFETLHDLGYKCLGTMRQNRLNEANLLSEKALSKARGSIDRKSYSHGTGRIIALAWYDNKRVLLCSNFVGKDPITTCKRWNRRDKKMEDVPVPAIVRQWNSFMGSVDFADMMISQFHIPFRSKKWYRSLVFRLFDYMLYNSWIVYRSFHSDSSFSDFRLSIAAELLVSEPPRSEIPSEEGQVETTIRFKFSYNNSAMFVIAL